MQMTNNRITNHEFYKNILSNSLLKEIPSVSSEFSRTVIKQIEQTTLEGETLRKNSPYLTSRRILIKTDVGKRIFLPLPTLLPNGNYDWSYTNKDCPLTLLAVHANGKIDVSNGLFQFTCNNHREWCPLEEQINQTADDKSSKIEPRKNLSSIDTLKIQFPHSKAIDLSANHALEIPEKLKKRENIHPSLEPSPNFAASCPYAILGLNVEENDLNYIKERYKKLALQHHPDKNGGKVEVFQIISNAYHNLLSQWEIDAFTFTHEDSLEEIYLQVAYTINSMKILLSLQEIQEQLPKLPELHDRLSSVLQHRAEKISLHYKMQSFVHQLNHMIKNYQIKQTLSLICMPSSHLSVSVRQLHLAQIIPSIKALLPSARTWGANAHSRLFANAHAWVVDKYLAFNRSLAELFIIEEDKASLAELAQKMFIFSFISDGSLAKGKTEIQKADAQFCSEWRQHCPPPTATEHPSQIQQPYSSIVVFTESSFQPAQKKKHCAHAHLDPLDQEMNLLEENIKKNKQFFTNLWKAHHVA